MIAAFEECSFDACLVDLDFHSMSQGHQKGKIARLDW